MIDISSIMAVAGSLKTAGEMTKGLLDLKEAAAIQSKVVELTSVIMVAQGNALTAQIAQQGLISEIRALKDKLAKFEDWNAEASRYALKDYGNETFAYELKSEFLGGEPSHRLCATCFHAGRKSILQKLFVSDGQGYFRCHPCNHEQAFGVENHSTRSYVVRSEFDV